ncbi:restriction endonuclease subunit S [Mycoplasma sp. Z631]|uniref:restriction endonuclease subunit S n=1 Tax=Mycoplasma sp. Z631 TaxID=3401685 RepID=UPI003AAEF662
MEKEKLVPAIRFKGFDEEWKRAIFSDFIDYERPDKYIEKLPLLEFGQIPVLTANKSFKLGYTESQNYYAKGDCILFDDFTLDSKYVNFPFMVVSSALKILSLKNSQDSLPYYFAILKNNTFESQGHARHYISIVAKTPIKISDNIEERNLIGSFFTYMNMLICYQESKLEKLQTIKQSLLDKMFAFYDQKVPEIRFKGFSEELKRDYLAKYASVTIGEFIIQTRLKETGEYPVYNGGINPTGFYNSFNNSENKIIISARGSNAGYINFITSKYWSGNSCYTVNFINNELAAKYVFWLMKRFNYFNDNLQSANIPSISKKDVESIILSFPSYDEQQKIGQFFSSLDSLIRSQEQKLEKLNNIKQALLEKMFC